MGGGVVGARHASPYGEGVVGRARGLAPTGDRREGFHPISLGLMSPRCHCEERVPERRSNPLNRVAQEAFCQGWAISQTSRGLPRRTCGTPRNDNRAYKPSLRPRCSAEGL